MRKVSLKQSAVLSLFIDCLVKLSLICPWLKQVVDQLVDYYRQLLLKGKNICCPVCLSLHIVKNGHSKRLFGSPIQNYLCRGCPKSFLKTLVDPYNKTAFKRRYVIRSLRRDYWDIYSSSQFFKIFKSL